MHHSTDSYIKRLKKIHAVTADLGRMPDGIKRRVLEFFAKRIAEKKESILEANRRDILFARRAGRNEAFLDRLAITDKKITSMSKEVQLIAALPDPVGRVHEEYSVPSGIRLKKITVPLGVLFIIYESRPDVTVNASALCIKSGNAVILKGGSEAIHTNKILAALITEALKKYHMPSESVTLLDTADRSRIRWLLKQAEYIDVVIPRGGYNLVKTVQAASTIPVLAHAAGGARIYIDASADLAKAIAICINAKTSRPATCNSVDTIVVHHAIAKKFVPLIASALRQQGVILYGDREARGIADMDPATHSIWTTEFLSKKVSIKIVHSPEEAIRFIQAYSKHHSEGIIAEDHKIIDSFVSHVDAASLFINCSTRLHDGSIFGFGAEMGIATGKLHARGPVGLQELTTYTWVAYGSGQIRE